jgi:hypothetical protein
VAVAKQPIEQRVEWIRDDDVDDWRYVEASSGGSTGDTEPLVGWNWNRTPYESIDDDDNDNDNDDDDDNNDDSTSNQTALTIASYSQSSSSASRSNTGSSRRDAVDSASSHDDDETSL